MILFIRIAGSACLACNRQAEKGNLGCHRVQIQLQPNIHNFSSRLSLRFPVHDERPLGQSPSFWTAQSNLLQIGLFHSFALLYFELSFGSFVSGFCCLIWEAYASVVPRFCQKLFVCQNQPKCANNRAQTFRRFASCLTRFRASRIETLEFASDERSFAANSDFQ